MSRERSTFLLWSFDVVLAAVSILAVHLIRYSYRGALLPLAVGFVPETILYALALTLSVAACGGYEPRLLRRGPELASRLVVAALLALVLVSVAGFLARDLLLGRITLFPALFASIVLMWAWRAAFARAFAVLPITRQLAVVGDEPFVSRLRQVAQETGTFRVVDVLGLDEVLALDGDGAKDLVARLVDRGVDELVVAARDRRGRLPLDFLMGVRARGIRVSDYAEVFERETGRVDLDAVRPSWFIFSEGFEGSRLEHFVKRLFDICAAAFMLVASAPLLLVAAAAIWLEDGRPIFYSQPRVGLGGKPFRLIKLRTMRKDAEKDGPRFAGVDDPRITRVGRILRRFRIDELPQLFHVLAGEMSFVGPRPERPEFVRELSRVLPWFEQRHRVKPGLAGWAQLNAPYAADVETARLKLEYDLYYLKHWSFTFDLAILLRTFQVVVWGNGVR